MSLIPVLTQELCFYTSLGQKIYGEARGKAAGYEWPQISIHRADLHSVLVEAVRERLKATFVQIQFEGPQEFARRLEAEAKLYGEIITAAKIKMP